MATERINWLSHSFGIYPPEAKWSDTGGLYIFAGINAQNEWVPLYIGRASSLAERLANHERWQEAVQLGATHIHAKAVKQEDDRSRIEENLIEAFQPRLNTQLK